MLRLRYESSAPIDRRWPATAVDADLEGPVRADVDPRDGVRESIRRRREIFDYIASIIEEVERIRMTRVPFGEKPPQDDQFVHRPTALEVDVQLAGCSYSIAYSQAFQLFPAVQG